MASGGLLISLNQIKKAKSGKTSKRELAGKKKKMGEGKI